MTDAYGGAELRHRLPAGRSLRHHWPLQRSHGWYDLVASSEADSRLRVQLAGHVETGRDGISDPLMGGVTAG